MWKAKIKIWQTIFNKLRRFKNKYMRKLWKPNRALFAMNYYVKKLFAYSILNRKNKKFWKTLKKLI